MSIDLDKLTLGEFEAIAARLEAAAKVFREARQLLGGAAATQPASASATPLAVASPAPREFTPYELAQREALLQRNRELPDEIKNAERMAPPNGARQ